MDWQYSASLGVVAAAVGYLAWLGWKTWRTSKKGCAGGCGCAKIPSSQAVTSGTLIAPEQLVIRRPKREE